MVRVLELFAGTGSVGKVCKKLGYEVISLDLKNADINCNILDWDYKEFPSGHFDIIWASPPCHTFSSMRTSWIGRKLKSHNGQICTAELLQKDIDERGLPILRKAEEIIDYFNPNLYFIENPKTGKMKKYIDKPFYDVDYCMYSDWGYQKPTRIWTNKLDFNAKKCDKNCGNMVNGRHKANFGCRKCIIDESGNHIKLTTDEQRKKYKDYKNVYTYISNLKRRYRIPENLISELLN